MDLPSIDSGSSLLGRRIGQFFVPLVVGCALFMQTLDSTVVATALPAMARSLHQNPVRLNIVITTNLLSLAIFIPLSGWLADKFGARTIFRAAIAIFTAGSVLCGVSQSLIELIAARFVQGIGGAMMSPVGRLLVLKSLPKTDWVEAISYLTVPAMLGPVIGPPLGGVIVSYSTWRWIFFINLPVGVIVLVLVALLVGNIHEDDAPPLDMVGFALTAFGLVGLIFGLESIGRGILPAGIVVAILVAGLACLGLYYIHARRADHPIISIKLLRIPTFNVVITGGNLFRTGIETMPFLLAILFQVGFGLSPFVSGILTFFSAASALAMKMTANPIVRRFGFRSVLIVNCVSSAGFMMLCASFRLSTPYVVIIGALVAGGFCRSLEFTSMAALCYADVPDNQMSEASSLASMTQQVVMSLGITLAALVLNFSLAAGGRSTLSARDISPAFLALGMVSLLATAFFARLQHDAGAELRGRRPDEPTSMPGEASPASAQ